MSDEKDVMKMTRAEFARAKQELVTQTAIDAKRAEGERAMEKIQRRHEHPREPMKVKPIDDNVRVAPVGNGLSKLL